MFRLLNEREKTDGFLNIPRFFAPIKEQDEMEYNHTSDIKIIHNGKDETLTIHALVSPLDSLNHLSEALTDLPSPPSAS